MAANPSFAECWTQAGLALKLANAVNLFGSSTTPNVADMLDALTTGVDGAYTPDLIAAAKAAARNIAAAVSPEALRAMWRPALLEMVRSAGITGLQSTDDVELLRAVRQYMVDNNQTIRARGMTLGSPTPSGSNVGNGSLFRCTVDKDGFPLECTGAEAKQAKVILDAHTGGARKFAEVFLFSGKPASPYGNLRWEGSGSTLAKRVEAVHPETGRIVLNASFDTNSASADNTAPTSATAITNWTIGGDPSNLRLRSAPGYTFSRYPGAPTTMWSVEFVANDSLKQVIADVRPGVQFGREPYFVGLRYMRKASATGTLKLALGASEVTANIGDVSNDQWSLLYLPLNEVAYFANFNEDGLALVIEVNSLATGTVVVDHLVVCPMANVDGTYYLPVSGSTPFLAGDLFTWTDQDGTVRAVFAFLLWLAFGPEGWLPSTEPAAEVVAVGGRTLTFAASDDSITASSGDFKADGYRPGMLLTSEGTSSNNGTWPILTVTATKITVDGALTDEGPLSSSAKINAAPPISDPT